MHFFWLGIFIFFDYQNIIKENFILTTILRVSSLTFLVLLHNAKADEWENITGASLASIVSLDVFLELCDRSIIMPSRFNSFITVCERKQRKYFLFVGLLASIISFFANAHFCYQSIMKRVSFLLLQKSFIIRKLYKLLFTNCI